LAWSSERRAPQTERASRWARSTGSWLSRRSSTVEGGAAHEALGVGGALEGEGALDHLDEELEGPALALGAGAVEGLFLGGVGGAAVGAAPEFFGVGGAAASAVAEEARALGHQVGGGG
jgi:hypothetical protein